MRRWLAALMLVPSFLGLAASDAPAISAGCLPGGFPATPGPDALARTFTTLADDVFRGELWRVVCADDPNEIALLFSVTPLQNESAFVCSDFDFHFLQDNQAIVANLREAPSATAFCGDVPGGGQTTTFFLEPSSSPGPPFDPTRAFTLSYDDAGSGGIQNIDVPAGGGIVTVVSTGCNPCRAGETATFHVHAVNSGPPVAVELRAGIRFPNNGPQVAIVGLCTETVLKTGAQDIPLASIDVPDDVPNGTYTVEVAIVDPIFAVTLSRHSLAAVKQ